MSRRRNSIPLLLTLLASPLLLLPLMLPARPDARESDTPDTGSVTKTIPAPPEWLGELDALYSRRIRVAGLEDRTFAPEHWWKVATPLLPAARGFRVETIARSAQGRPLRHVAWGTGSKRVLLWSQMHGDESTATMALADLFRFLGEHPTHPLVERLRQHTTLHFLPLMNPDGAARFQRRNAQGIDINRDARALASPEARALHALRERIRPTFGFNLHDQQVGYRAGDSDRQVAVALLAPAFDETGAVNTTRARAIEIAVAIRAVLEPYVSGRIARWDDRYNPRAFGDLTARSGVSTLLIESGGVQGDPQKQVLRKLNFLALLGALDAIATGAHAGLPRAGYDALPGNGAVWPDLLITGATLVLPGSEPAKTDVLVDFSDPLRERGGTIEDIGDLHGTRARRRIDASDLYLHPFNPPERLASQPAAFAPEGPAYFRLTRDLRGRDTVWTLAGDVDPAQPEPGVGAR